ncbi:MAG TPA: TIGR03435 family protein [Acidobacteriaceae bacterium]|jgi:uncharacterized protein (TIGR03435 family)|nr:TIGR03435 family protein [Acidobacteriaceae bacterium]
MRKLVLTILASTAMFTARSFAQDLTGNWQGTLHAQRDLRLIVNFSPDAHEKMTAKVYSIDQGSQGMNASSVMHEGTGVKIAVESIDGLYEGKLSADAKTMTGTWTQGGHTTPLVLVRSTPDTAWEIPKPKPQEKPMAPDANPSFEVATIKPNDPDKPGNYFRVNGRTFTTHNISLAGMVQFAYGVQAKQIVNAPDWMHDVTYDITAVPDAEGAPNDKQWKSMLQKMLADRFKLSFHHEERELPVFALAVGKEGPKNLTENTNGGALPGMFFRGTPGGIMLPAGNASFQDFCGLLQEVVLDRPVIDRTGLKGRYDFTLKWAPDQTQFGGHGPPAGVEVPDAPPELFTAIQEQIGLKLESTKASVPVLAIDHVEKPSEN